MCILERTTVTACLFRNLGGCLTLSLAMVYLRQNFCPQLTMAFQGFKQDLFFVLPEDVTGLLWDSLYAKYLPFYWFMATSASDNAPKYYTSLWQSHAQQPVNHIIKQTILIRSIKLYNHISADLSFKGEWLFPMLQSVLTTSTGSLNSNHVICEREPTLSFIIHVPCQ